METELYDIPGVSSRYKISKNGVVKNTSTGRIIKPYLVSKGYWMVCLCENRVRTRLYIHRILALLFVSNPHKKPFVNHINGVMQDNRIENLEWVTPKENIRHAYKIGLVTHIIKVHQGAKWKEEDIIRIRKLYECGTTTAIGISKIYGMSLTNVWHILKKRSWKHI